MAQPLAFRRDKKITELFAAGHFTLSAEIIPPRNGVEQNIVLNQVQALTAAGADFLAVTKGAGGSLRGGSLPIAQLIKEQLNVPCIAHFTCRDLLPVDVENQLIDHHYFGICNILALRGDPPDGQKEWTLREGGYNYAYQLIEQIRNMNAGQYLPRPGILVEGSQEPTDFCIGAAAYPDQPNKTRRIDFFDLKIKAGADYGITDMLFDADSYGKFLDECEKNSITVPILPGTRVLKSQRQASKMLERFRTRIPPEFLQKLPEEETPENLPQSIEVTLEFVERLKRLGAPGVHFFVIGDTEPAVQALRRLASDKKKVNN